MGARRRRAHPRRGRRITVEPTAPRACRWFLSLQEKNTFYFIAKKTIRDSRVTFNSPLASPLSPLAGNKEDPYYYLGSTVHSKAVSTIVSRVFYDFYLLYETYYILASVTLYGRGKE